MKMLKIGNQYFWQTPVKLRDVVQTADGFSGKISSIEKGKIRVLLDASADTLKKFGKKKIEIYDFNKLF